MKRPYVISAELDLAKPDIINRMKIDNFRQDLDADLRSMDKNVLWVPARTMRGGLQRTLSKTSLPTVSLDDRYVMNADQYIGISRGADMQLNDAGYVSRVGYQSVSEQLDRTSAVGNEVIIADDVVYSGEMITWLADELRSRNVKIGGVVCGIAMRKGIEKLEHDGIGIEAVLTFDDVEDEICERDFVVMPGSGRRVASLSANALYFDNVNGRPEKWASLPPDNVEKFCINNLERNIDLLQPMIPMQKSRQFYWLRTRRYSAPATN